jgi:hypothetical protein
LGATKPMNFLLLILPNTDRVQQVEDYDRGYTWQLTKAKATYHYFVLNSNKMKKKYYTLGNSSLECFKRAIQK